MYIYIYIYTFVHSYLRNNYIPIGMYINYIINVGYTRTCAYLTTHHYRVAMWLPLLLKSCSRSAGSVCMYVFMHACMVTMWLPLFLKSGSQPASSVCMYVCMYDHIWLPLHLKSSSVCVYMQTCKTIHAHIAKH